MKLLVSALLVGISTMTASVATAAPRTVVADVEPVVVPVSDMPRALDFYTRVLDFTQIGDREVAGSDYEHLFGVLGARVRVAQLRLGGEVLELPEFAAPRDRPLPVDLHSNDRAFQHVAIVVSDMDRVYARLRGHNVEHASTGPQVLPDWNPNTGGIAAFYYRDSEGNFLEILHFPPGKGAPRWQSRDARFLGIDHTAIVVSDTEASLHYYRDLLGLAIAGESDNYGSEQEHLNNVSGTHLRITALRAKSGPGVELLEYLTPVTGRPIPADSQANDRWYWQINFASAEPDALLAAVRAAHAPLVSNDVVALTTPILGFSRAVVVRDPDGHATAITATIAP